MPAFSKKSTQALKTCNLWLQLLFNEVVKEFDCSIIDGRRGKKRQDLYFRQGRSQVKWAKSRHNVIAPALSDAVDVVPYIDALGGATWDKEQLLYFGGYVVGVASRLSIPIRWGGDWNLNNNIYDQKFQDLAHFELKKGD